MKNQNLSIGFLCVTALILFIANFLPVQPLAQAEALKDRDYSLIAAKSARGGDTIYVVDNRTGMVAILSWNASTRNFELVGSAPLANAFNQ
jgi:hypothetical protein